MKTFFLLLIPLFLLVGFAGQVSAVDIEEPSDEFCDYCVCRFKINYTPGGISGSRNEIPVDYVHKLVSSDGECRQFQCEAIITNISNGQNVGGELQTTYDELVAYEQSHSINMNIVVSYSDVSWISCTGDSFSLDPNEPVGGVGYGEDPLAVDEEEGSGVAQDTIDTSLCSQVTGPNNSKCTDCFDSGGIWTAIGCVPTEPVAMIKTFIYVGISIGGGVALISFISAGFLYTTSKGDPQKVSSAKELMTSSVIGLLFVIFSITILQFIARDLLAIPGFGV